MRIPTAIAAALILLTLCSRAPASGDIRVADEQLFSRLDINSDGQLVADELGNEQRRLFARLLRLGDQDKDGQLSEREWRRAITPRRPAKPIEEKQPSELPGAEAIRLVLLKLDADADGVLTKAEAPRELRPVFAQIVEQFDRNDNGQVNRLELARGGPRITRIAQQAVRRLDLNVERELKKLDREQGDASQRFSEQPSPQRMLADPQQSRALFEQFDGNNDGKLHIEEVPDQLQDRLGRLFRFGDRDRDGALSEREFLAATKRASRLLQRMSPETD